MPGDSFNYPYSHDMSENFRPLFVGGSGRSGTTILVNLLNHHSQVHTSLPREIKYLTSRFGLIDLIYGRRLSLEENALGMRNNLAARGLPIMGKSKIKLFEKYMQGSWWCEAGKKGKPRGLIQGISKQTLDSALEIFAREFGTEPLGAARNIFYQLSRHQINDSGIKYFADSTPVNMMQANFLYQIFPEAFFINMVRDGRDVALSVVSEKWGPNDPYVALNWWANRVLRANLALDAIPKEQKLTLRIENLVVRDRQVSLKSILDLLAINSEKKLEIFFSQQMTEANLNQGRWQSEIENPSKFESKYLEVLGKLMDKGVTVERFY